MYEINKKITLELLEKDKIDQIFAGETRKRNRAAIEMFKPWIKGNVFEIGCRHGVLLDMLNENLTFGIDISKEAVDLARKKGLNCEVIKTFSQDKHTWRRFVFKK